MKKLLLCLVSLATMVMLLGCSVQNVEGSLEELMEKIYAGADVRYPITFTKAITPDMDPQNFIYNFGTSNIKFEEALVSDAMVMTTAHSVVLIRVSDNENVKALIDRIKKSEVGMKWICTGVPPNEVIVDNIGNLVVIIIDKNNPTKPLHDSFKQLAQ